MTFPFIERKMKLGLVEGVLQLGDTAPSLLSAVELLILLQVLMLLLG